MSMRSEGLRYCFGYGWLEMITQEEYETCDSWEYDSFDELDLFIIAFNRHTGRYAWVERSPE